jgi:hypothetical protein
MLFMETSWIIIIGMHEFAIREIMSRCVNLFENVEISHDFPIPYLIVRGKREVIERLRTYLTILMVRDNEFIGKIVFFIKGEL